MWETTIQVEQSEVVRGEPGQLWALMRSPALWSLWRTPAFMFDVPGGQALRFYIGVTRRGLASVLFEIVDELPGTIVRVRSLPTARQEFTLSVIPGRRGTTKASVQIKEIVPRQFKINYEAQRRKLIKNWLSAVRAVIECRTPWPDDVMSADLRQRCLARPLISDAQRTSASTVIGADPDTVWDVVHSPETARVAGPSKAIYSGYVPGTPEGQPGEMQYFISQHDDHLHSSVAVVAEIAGTAGQRSALTHSLGPTQVETGYLLTYESASGPTRLDVTYRWHAPEKLDAADAARSRMAEHAQAVTDGFRSLIEAASGSNGSAR